MPETLTLLPPLKITCTSSDCEEGLHCFKATRKLKAENREGACRSCGAELVNWDRLHDCRIDDVEHTFEALQFELVRHHSWHLEFDERAINHARRKGRIKLNQAARQRLQTSVGKAADAFDGRRTRWSGNTIYYAQHAVAACCRTCMKYWHGIEPDRALTETELDYLFGLVTRYLDARLPGLSDLPEHVPPIRRSAHVSRQ